MSVIFKRKLYNRMLAWKNERKGSTALLVKGARRVGKSTLVEQFAKEQYRSYILVDFAHAPKNVTDLFEDMYDLDFFFMQLQIRYGITLHQRESVIIFCRGTIAASCKTSHQVSRKRREIRLYRNRFPSYYQEERPKYCNSK